MASRVILSRDNVQKRFRQALYLLWHAGAHRRYMVSIRDARRRGLAGTDRLLHFKYLGVYLARSLTTAMRRRAIMYHHSFLARTIPNPPHDYLHGGGTPLWQGGGTDDRRAAILLEPSLACPMEGESQLRFHRDGRNLCTLTFAIVDGAGIGLTRGSIMFVGGVAGGIDCRREIRDAAKSNGEIAPLAMLLLAARALAEVLGIERIAGAASADQAACDYAHDRIRHDYDAMWAGLGATLDAAGYFVTTPWPVGLPAEPHGSHRSRTRRRRLRKAEIRDQIAATARRQLGLDSPVRLRDR